MRFHGSLFSQMCRWVCCPWSSLPVAWPCLASLSLYHGSCVGSHGGSVACPPPSKRLLLTSFPAWALYPPSLHRGSLCILPWTPQHTAAVSPLTVLWPGSPLQWRQWCLWRLLCPLCPRLLWSKPPLRQPWRSATHLQTFPWMLRARPGKMASTPLHGYRGRPQSHRLTAVQWRTLGKF